MLQRGLLGVQHPFRGFSISYWSWNPKSFHLIFLDNESWVNWNAILIVEFCLPWTYLLNCVHKNFRILFFLGRVKLMSITILRPIKIFYYLIFPHYEKLIASFDCLNHKVVSTSQWDFFGLVNLGLPLPKLPIYLLHLTNFGLWL